MADPQKFTYAGVAFPLTAAHTGDALLGVADSSIATLLDFYAYTIGYYLGTALTDAATVCGAPITSNVAYKLPHDPARLARVEHLKFPLLAVWRKGEKYEDRTIQRRHRTCDVGIAYVLPPLTPAQLERLVPVLAAVGMVVDDRTRNGRDPGYQSGATLQSLTSFEEVRLESAELGAYAWQDVASPNGGGVDFPAWNGSLVLLERQMADSRGLAPYTGSTASIVESPPDGTTADVVVNATS